MKQCQIGNLHHLGPVLVIFEIFIGRLTAKLRFNGSRGLAGHVPLVEPLHRQLTCRASRLLTRRRGPLGARCTHESTPSSSSSSPAPKLRSSETISMAAMAASVPLLPALVPERSTACSIELTVRTPLAMGVSNSS